VETERRGRVKGEGSVGVRRKLMVILMLCWLCIIAQ
jgi:hypothetical protein